MTNTTNAIRDAVKQAVLAGVADALQELLHGQEQHSQAVVAMSEQIKEVRGMIPPPYPPDYLIDVDELGMEPIQ